MRRKDREVTDIYGIEDILKLCKTCHVAMVDNGMPYVVPLSYGYKIIKGSVLELYFHSAPEGRKLDVLKRNNKVCFNMAQKGEPVHSDNPCKAGYYYSSVIGFGEVTFMESDDDKSEALSFIVKHQSGKDVRFTPEQTKGVCVFKIISKEFTGKKKKKGSGGPDQRK
jgi:nitroimidazol reductase NimA-like FMN-containing flavoprotein (pyridoxamine 5'-phosphate oxidase superfamily)